MIILFTLLYFVVFITTFCCLVHSERKYRRYVSAGCLFFFTMMSVTWPFTWIIFLVVVAYEQLEKVVNK